MTSFIVDMVFVKGLSMYTLKQFVYILAFMLPWRVIRVTNSKYAAANPSCITIQLLSCYNSLRTTPLLWLEVIHHHLYELRTNLDAEKRYMMKKDK